MKINYVVSFYINKDAKYKRNNFYTKIDELFALKCHLKQLEQLDLPHIVRATFVLNTEYVEIFNLVKNFVDTNYTGKIPIDIIMRKNWGRSYAAWEYQIRNSIDQDYDYYFLIEDDYCPVINQFYIPFYNLFDKETAAVCMFYLNNHPAISIKMISKQCCKFIYDKYNEIFYGYNELSKKSTEDLYKIENLYGIEYNVDWQVIYHKHFLDENLKFKDTSHVASSRFKSYLNIIDLNPLYRDGILDQSLQTLILPIY